MHNETQLTTPQQANNAYYPAPQAQFNAVAPAPYSPQYATPENQHATPQSINNTYFPAPQAQLNAVSPAPYPPQYAIPENKHTSLQPANNAYYPAPQAQLNAVAPVSYPPQYVTPETQKAPDTIMNVGPGVYNNPVQSAVTEQRAQGSVVPLYALAFSPALVDCPQCSQRGMTVIDYINGTTTHAWAVFLFIMTIFCVFVPYLFNELKDVQHRCVHCRTLLATWHRGSGTEVHIHQRV